MLCETNSFIYGAIENKYSEDAHGIIKPDQRGRRVPFNKISDKRIAEVIAHIDSFPAYISHYSRKHTSKKYLPVGLNLSKMFALYRESTQYDPVSITIYSQEFKKMGLKFKKPKIDTCSTCDSLAIAISASTGEARTNIEIKLKEHQQAADDAYDAKKKDKLFASSRSDTAVFTFDLQQVLQTPYLTSNKAYYKRQLSTYNLTIHNCLNSMATHCMWHEGVSGRGANEI